LTIVTPTAPAKARSGADAAGKALTADAPNQPIRFAGGLMGEPPRELKFRACWRNATREGPGQISGTRNMQRHRDQRFATQA